MTGNEPGSNDDARREQEDAEWRSIVDNYGDRPEFTAPSSDAASSDAPAPDSDEHPWPSLRSSPMRDEPAELAPSWEEDDRYVPPPAPPVPVPHGLRLAAWLGLFGVPAVVLVWIVLGISLPSPLDILEMPLGLLAFVWFVGGFGYLVATMGGPKDSGGGWDDGAVV